MGAIYAAVVKTVKRILIEASDFDEVEETALAAARRDPRPTEWEIDGAWGPVSDTRSPGWGDAPPDLIARKKGGKAEIEAPLEGGCPKKVLFAVRINSPALSWFRAFSEVDCTLQEDHDGDCVVALNPVQYDKLADTAVETFDEHADKATKEGLN